MNLQSHKQWGLSTSLNLYGCDKSLVTNEEALREFIIRLCDLIDVKRYGEPLIEHFAKHNIEVAGYTLIQLIETSSITGHFVDLNGNAYIDVFSCKTYDPEKVNEFCRSYFKPEEVMMSYITR
jgi:S-adenosylmethionine/arginine decarboxylase-like enzyme